MVNSEDFAKRLQRVIDYYGESASSFAEKIGVQRSSISHILSGRNKPSLEFVLKVLASFPEVELYWLLNGKGSFPSSDLKTENKTIKQKGMPFDMEVKKTTKDISKDNAIERIVIFYSDGSFKNFEN